MTDTQMLDMILLNQKKTLAILEAMNRTTATTPFGEFGGTTAAAAPTKAEIANDPGKYSGTKYDPFGSDVVPSRAAIRNFETQPDIFIGGTVAQWFRADPAAMLAWFRSTHEGHDLDLGKLSPDQLKLLNLL